MNSELFHIYFTDNQIAAIEGITLGGLRNKIYRLSKGATPDDANKPTAADLPEFISVSARNRVWHKETVRAWLMQRYRGDEQVVDRLMKAGEACVPARERDVASAKLKTGAKAD